MPHGSAWHLLGSSTPIGVLPILQEIDFAPNSQRSREHTKDSMNLDFRHLFSRFGSYMAFSRLPASPDMDEDVPSSVHGGIAHQILFRPEVLDGSTSVPLLKKHPWPGCAS